MKNKIKTGLALSAALMTLFAAAAGADTPGADTPGDSMGNGQNPMDRNDNGASSQGSHGNNSSDLLVYNTAIDDYNHRHYKGVAPGLKDYLRENPKDAETHRLMADIDIAQNNIAAAIPEWEAAVHLDRNDKGSMANLGVAYVQTGSYDKTIIFYQNQLGHNAKDAKMRVQFGSALDGAGRHAEAAATFEKAALVPKDSMAALYAGLLNHRSGHDDKAVPELKTALALGTTQKFQAYAALAEAASAAKQGGEAIKNYALAGQANPTDFVTFANLGALEQNSGKKADAEAAYRQAVTLKAGDPKVLAAIQSNLALLLTGDGKIDDAAAFLVKATANDPANALFQNNLGQVCEKQGKKDLVIAAYAKAVSLDPSLPSAKGSAARLSK